MPRWRLCLPLLLATLVAQQTGAQDEEIAIVAADWEPFTSATLYDGGLLIEIAVEALKRGGHRARVDILPWKRAFQGTKEGIYDALAGASYAQEREQFFHFPEHHYPTKVSFFARKGRYAAYEKLEDLCPATVGVLRGSFLVGLLEPTSCLTLELANDVLTNVKKLARGRIDLMVETQASVYFYLNRDMPYRADAIEAVSPVLVDDRIYTVFSKKLTAYEAVAEDYDRGVGSMKSDGTYDAILKKYGIAER